MQGRLRKQCRYWLAATAADQTKAEETGSEKQHRAGLGDTSGTCPAHMADPEDIHTHCCPKQDRVEPLVL